MYHVLLRITVRDDNVCCRCAWECGGLEVECSNAVEQGVQSYCYQQCVVVAVPYCTVCHSAALHCYTAAVWQYHKQKPSIHPTRTQPTFNCYNLQHSIRQIPVFIRSVHRGSAEEGEQQSVTSGV